jgi:hypothetical protein
MLLHLYFLVAEVPGKCQVGSAAIEQYFGIHVNVAKVEGTFYMVWNISWTFSFMVAWSCNRDLDIPAETVPMGFVTKGPITVPVRYVPLNSAFQ